MSMHVIEVPVGWDAIRGEPAFTIRFEQPPTEVMLSEVTMERLQRIWGPVRFTAQIAVAEAMERFHDADEAAYHEQRPAAKLCPFDEACRFV